MIWVIAGVTFIVLAYVFISVGLLLAGFALIFSAWGMFKFGLGLAIIGGVIYWVMNLIIILVDE